MLLAWMVTVESCVTLVVNADTEQEASVLAQELAIRQMPDDQRIVAITQLPSGASEHTDAEKDADHVLRVITNVLRG